jgi:plastocyanin
MKEDKVTNMDTTSKRPRRTVWVVVVLALIVAVALAWAATRPAAPKSAATPAPDIVINITDHGFVPATLVVDAGTKVTWHNQTASPHQVGSNPYPGHTDLPGLYSASAIGPDETYSYTFSQTGTFGYSDYTQPTVGGTVTVK